MITTPQPQLSATELSATASLKQPLMPSPLTEGWQRRFAGIGRLYGQQALALFARSRVCVVGIGGVGSWAAEALVRSGIGAVTLVDLDDICISNSNRQIHALQAHIGQPKTTVMAQRLAQINPECAISVIDDFISEENVARYIRPDFHYVIDAIDSVRAKAALIAYCRRQKIPLVTTGGAGGLCDVTKIQLADLAKTVQDPLAAKVRERLKRDHGVQKNSKGKLGIDCVFSSEQQRYPQPDGTVCAGKPVATGGGGLRLDCASGFGAATMITATFGFLAVSHVLQKMLRKAAAKPVLPSDV